MPARQNSRGFTLLEVMVAVAILGLGLTVVLSSQAGLLSSAQRVRNETYASSLMRCRMAELELELIEEGFSLVDQSESGECCEDEDEPGFSCEWRVETVELPQPASFTPEAEGADDAASDLSQVADEAKSAASDAAAPGGGLGALALLQPGASPALGEGAELGDLAGLLGDSSPGGPGGMIQMALGLVYPDLKPMLEASIRKVTVVVKWREGSRERDFTVVSYVTDPREGALNPNVPEGLEALSEQLLGDQLEQKAGGEE